MRAGLARLHIPLGTTASAARTEDGKERRSNCKDGRRWQNMADIPGIGERADSIGTGFGSVIVYAPLLSVKLSTRDSPPISPSSIPSLEIATSDRRICVGCVLLRPMHKGALLSAVSSKDKILPDSSDVLLSATDTAVSLRLTHTQASKRNDRYAKVQCHSSVGYRTILPGFCNPFWTLSTTSD